MRIDAQNFARPNPAASNRNRIARRIGGWAISGVAIATLLGGAFAASAQWASGASVYSEDGIEITVDARVVSVFAVLNSLGYDEESNRGPAPLQLPKFHVARETARDAMGRPGRAVRKIGKVVRKNPASTDAYLVAATQLGSAPKFTASAGASKLAKGISSPLRDWYNEEGGASIVRTIRSKVGGEQKLLLKPINKITGEVKKLVRLGDEEDQLLDDTGPSGRVIVALNPLDTHGAMMVAPSAEATLVIAGPLTNKSASTELIGAVAFAYAKTLVGTEASKAAVAGSLADGFKTLPANTKKALGDAKAYAVELMACAVVKTARATLPCVGSSVEGEASKEALATLQQRFAAHAKTADPFAPAVPVMFGAPAVAAPAVPPAAVPPAAVPPAAVVPAPQPAAKPLAKPAGKPVAPKKAP